jgi:hypothetical protein
VVNDDHCTTYNRSVILFKENVHNHHVHFEDVRYLHPIRVVNANPHQHHSMPLVVWQR